MTISSLALARQRFSIGGIERLAGAQQRLDLALGLAGPRRSIRSSVGSSNRRSA